MCTKTAPSRPTDQASFAINITDKASDPKTLLLRSLRNRICLVRGLCIFSQALFLSGVALSGFNAVKCFDSGYPGLSAIATVCAITSACGIFASGELFSRLDKRLRVQVSNDCDSILVRTKLDDFIFFSS